MNSALRSSSPMVLLRISDGTNRMHREFNNFDQAVKSAEAFAGAGFNVELVSATGQFLMGFAPRVQRLPKRVIQLEASVGAKPQCGPLVP
jgi:hypothetical protein